MNTGSCDMKRRDPPAEVWELEVGEFCFEVDDKGQRWFNCTLPGETHCRIPVRPVLTPGINGGHSWEWDGNEDKPTLHPSVHCVGSWHGWIKAGRMESC